MFLSDRDIKARLTNYYSIVGHDCSFDQALDLIRNDEMPLWLKKIVENGAIVVDPYFSDNELAERLGSWSVDFDLGSTLYQPPASAEMELVLGEYVRKRYDLGILLENKVSLKEIDISTNSYIFEPGEFILATTRQKVILPPDIGAIITPRSRVARIGISSVGAPLIDAGFAGWITLEMKNDGYNAIILKFGLTICQISFCLLSSRSERPYFEKKGAFLGKRVL